MNRAHWSLFILFVMFCGILAGTAPCRGGLLHATDTADDGCCEERTMELDLCGDTCAGCSEHALVLSSGSSDQLSQGAKAQTPAVVPLHAAPVLQQACAPFVIADDGLSPPLLLPAHLSSTVLLR